MKGYKFTQAGLNKCIKDIKKDKSDKISNIIFYGIVGILLYRGIISYNTIINMAACSGTAKVVRHIMR